MLQPRIKTHKVIWAHDDTMTNSFARCPAETLFSPEQALDTSILVSLDQTVNSAQNASNSNQLSQPISATLNHLPGEPSIGLDDKDVHDFIQRELDTPVLDEMYPSLWLVGRQAFDHIDPLHRQRIKGRSVVPSEDSGLHMVWTKNTIYVKPLPLCLLNHNFWTQYLAEASGGGFATSVARDSRRSDRLIATGFLRSYAFLIRHRCDYEIAKNSLLIPGDFDWVQWSRFIHNFRSLKDDERVAKRYHYGQLRLSRLNWAVRLLRPQGSPTWWFYESPYWSTMSYVEAAAALLLFLFASVSLTLSSMQVMLAAPTETLRFPSFGAAAATIMSRAYWVLSLVVILLSLLSWTLLVGVPLGIFVWQLAYGFSSRKKVDPSMTCA
ncbi:hypothetical protein KCU78_g17551, partial [Aureobasidium melanogenum]